MRKGLTYNVNELNEVEAKGNNDSLIHGLYRPDKFVVVSEKVSDKTFFILGTKNCMIKNQ